MPHRLRATIVSVCHDRAFQRFLHGDHLAAPDSAKDEIGFVVAALAR